MEEGLWLRIMSQQFIYTTGISWFNLTSKLILKPFLREEGLYIRNKVFTIPHLRNLKCSTLDNWVQKWKAESLCQSTQIRNKESKGSIAKVSRNTWIFLLDQALYVHYALAGYTFGFTGFKLDQNLVLSVFNRQFWEMVQKNSVSSHEDSVVL